jgi:signal transduction histidine kinase
MSHSSEADAAPSASPFKPDPIQFFGLTEEDLKVLRLFQPHLDRHCESIVDGLVEHLLSTCSAQVLLDSPEAIAEFKRNQQMYLSSITREFDKRKYPDGWRRDGSALEWLTRTPLWFMGAYSYYQSRLVSLAIEVSGDNKEECPKILTALNRRMVLDLHLMIVNFLDQGFRSMVQQMEKMAAVGQLAAGLAHEIGTPLNVISGNAEYLMMEIPPESPMTEELKVIVRETERVSELISNLLKFARPAPASMQQLDPAVLVREVVSLLMQEISKNKINLDCQLDSLPLLEGDPNQLKQVFVNILLNAIQAMPENGKLEIGAKLTNDWLILTFQDNGQGIPQANLPMIFDPFFTTKSVGKGTGLGLSVCYRIVREHSGRIEVSSREGEGTLVEIRLPISPEANEER